MLIPEAAICRANSLPIPDEAPVTSAHGPNLSLSSAALTLLLRSACLGLLLCHKSFGSQWPWVYQSVHRLSARLQRWIPLSTRILAMLPGGLSNKKSGKLNQLCKRGRFAPPGLRVCRLVQLSILRPESRRERTNPY